MNYRSIYRRRLWLLPAGWVPAHQGQGKKCQTYTLGNDWKILRERLLAAQPAAIVPGEMCMDSVYYDAKRFGLDGTNGDFGATFWQLQSSLQAYGAASIPWIDGGNMSQEPPAHVYAIAAANKPIVFETAPYIKSGPSRDSLHETMALLLSQGKPVPLTMYASRELWMLPTSGNPDDVVYTYNPSDFIMEHAVLLIGRDMDKGLYYFLNSWGPGFGANGVFCMTFAEFMRCVTQHWHIKQSPISPVPEHNIMTNPLPGAITPEQLQRWEARVIAKLRAAKDANGWPGALGTAVLMGLSDKQFEKYAPPIDGGPGHGLPRHIVEHLCNTGEIQMPADFFEPDE